MSKPTYAHLLKSAAAAKAKEVDDNEKDRMEAPPENDKEDGKKGKKAKGKKAGEGESDEEREERESDEGESEEEKEDRKEKEEQDNEDKEDKKGKKSKKASASMSNDDAQVVRLEERVRCATIFQSDAAAGRPDVAAKFAFHTNLSADEAIIIMESLGPISTASAPSAGRARLDERMSTVRSANVGGDAGETISANGSVPMAALEKMSPAQRALAVVNAARELRGEEVLKSLP